MRKKKERKTGAGGDLNISRPSMQEDYYTRIIIIIIMIINNNKESYLTTCYLYNHIYARQMKSNSSKAGESDSSCSKLTLHSFQSENSWLRFDGQTVNCLNICINPLLLYQEGYPLSTHFGKQALFVTKVYDI